MSTFRAFPVEDVASWLDQHGADGMWTVDGETRLGRKVALPCSGTELAAAFRNLGGTVTLVGAEELAPDAPLDAFMTHEDEARTFAMTWSPNGEDDIWIMSEDLVANEAERAEEEPRAAL